MPPHDPSFVYGNQLEAVFWILVGFAFAVVALVRRTWRPHSAVAALAFVAFGVTDIVESHTGAWWRPWWLLVWKATCIGALLWLLTDYVRQRRRHAGR
jgi:hypothetical protein